MPTIVENKQHAYIEKTWKNSSQTKYKHININKMMDHCKQPEKKRSYSWIDFMNLFWNCNWVCRRHQHKCKSLLLNITIKKVNFLWMENKIIIRQKKMMRFHSYVWDSNTWNWFVFMKCIKFFLSLCVCVIETEWI